MALNFVASSSDKVALSAGLDNLNTFTILGWFYRTTTTLSLIAVSKGDDAKQLAHSVSFAGDIYFSINRATTTAIAQSSSTPLTQDAWTFVAATFDTTDGPRVFTGTLSAAASEVAYATRDTGSGAVSSDSASNWAIGNYDVTASFGFGGRIAVVGHYRRRMTLTEIISYQYHMRTDADCDIFMHLGFAGTGTQPNWTTLGNGINGTVTGATVVDHVPLRSPFAFDQEWQGAFTVAAAPGGAFPYTLALTGVGR